MDWKRRKIGSVDLKFGVFPAGLSNVNRAMWIVKMGKSVVCTNDVSSHLLISNVLDI